MGIRNTLLKNFSALEHRKDGGAILESFVFLELQKKITPENEIRFWRLKSGEEVDFIWIQNQKAFPIEVKNKISDGSIPSGMKAFIKRYPSTTKAFVLNGNYEGKTSLNGTEIVFTSWIHATKIPEMVEPEA